jgi:hypothetical protein
MKIFKWLVIAVLFLLTFMALHYSLPQKDTVRIVGTDVKRMDIGRQTWFWAQTDTLSDTLSTRDVRLFNANFQNGKPYVYRNEDTNWSYPPYLKFDSGSLTAAAQGLVSTDAAPIWAVVTHYGWRFELLTLFPNIVGIRRTESADEVLIPWFNIIFLLTCFMLLFLEIRGIIRLRVRHIDPISDDLSDFC